MGNKFGTCFTPTSLWNHLKEMGSGKYNIIIDKESHNDSLIKSITAKKWRK